MWNSIITLKVTGVMCVSVCVHLVKSTSQLMGFTDHCSCHVLVDVDAERHQRARTCLWTWWEPMRTSLTLWTLRPATRTPTWLPWLALCPAGVCVCVSVCLCFYLCVSVCVLSVCLCVVHVCLSMCACLYGPVCVNTSVVVQLCVCLYVCVFVHVCTSQCCTCSYGPVCVYMSVSTYPSVVVCAYVFLCMHLWAQVHPCLYEFE